MAKVWCCGSTYQLDRATSNFGINGGEGDFGAVYRAPSLPSLSYHGPCAIKVLNAGSLQGAGELMAELQLLSKCQHENLLPLPGFCLKPQRQCLVYPLMPGFNLEDRLSQALAPYIPTADNRHS